MQLHFSIQEFIKLDGIQADIPISPDIAQKILTGFLLPLNEVRIPLNHAIVVRSGYRPKWWELSKGRDGDSQHCYEAAGAADVALSNQKRGTWIHFFELLSEGPWTRIAYYPEDSFFHIDYKADSRQYFINNNGWQSSNQQVIQGLLR